MLCGGWTRDGSVTEPRPGRVGSPGCLGGWRPGEPRGGGEQALSWGWCDALRVTRKRHLFLLGLGARCYLTQFRPSGLVSPSAWRNHLRYFCFFSAPSKLGVTLHIRLWRPFRIQAQVTLLLEGITCMHTHTHAESHTLNASCGATTSQMVEGRFLRFLTPCSEMTTPTPTRVPRVRFARILEDSRSLGGGVWGSER